MLFRECKKQYDEQRNHEQLHGNTSVRDIINSAWNNVVQHFQVRTRDIDGCFPLHHACARMASPDEIKTLVGCFPRAVFLADNHGQLPLHHACSSSEASAEVIQTLLKAHSNAAAITDKNGRLPLHHACKYGAIAVVSQVLIAAYPQGASTVDDQGCLPLHYACSETASPQVVQNLLQAFPNGAAMPNLYGDLPLYLACGIRDAHSSTLVVRYLLEAFPGGAASPLNSTLPLHVMLIVGCTVETVKDLVKAFPGSARWKDADGHLPFHYFVLSRMGYARDDAEDENHKKVQKEIMMVLLDAYPDALRFPDRMGRSWSNIISFYS